MDDNGNKEVAISFKFHTCNCWYIATKRGAFTLKNNWMRPTNCFFASAFHYSNRVIKGHGFFKVLSYIFSSFLTKVWNSFPLFWADTATFKRNRNYLVLLTMSIMKQNKTAQFVLVYQLKNGPILSFLQFTAISYQKKQCYTIL